MAIKTPLLANTRPTLAAGSLHSPEIDILWRITFEGHEIESLYKDQGRTYIPLVADSSLRVTPHGFDCLACLLRYAGNVPAQIGYPPS
jgi:hypothetical protein